MYNPVGTHVVNAVCAEKKHTSNQTIFLPVSRDECWHLAALRSLTAENCKSYTFVPESHTKPCVAFCLHYTAFIEKLCASQTKEMARLLCLRPCVLLLVLACICTGLSTVQGSNSTATLRYTGSCKQKDYSEDEYSNDKGYGDEYSGNGDDDAYGGRRHDDDSDDGYGRNGNDYPYSKLQVSQLCWQQ